MGKPNKIFPPQVAFGRGVLSNKIGQMGKEQSLTWRWMERPVDEETAPEDRLSGFLKSFVLQRQWLSQTVRRGSGILFSQPPCPEHWVWVLPRRAGGRVSSCEAISGGTVLLKVTDHPSTGMEMSQPGRVCLDSVEEALGNSLVWGD